MDNPTERHISNSPDPAKTPLVSPRPFYTDASASRELNDEQLATLRKAESKKPLSLFRLPKSLEQDFRADYRERATSVIRTSVYGLTGLYLLVVLPISFLVDAPLKSTWLTFAVYPIGIALLIIWFCTRHLRKYTEYSLQFGAFLALAGPSYAFMTLGNSFLGLVAGCETIYVLMVVFSMLLLRIPEVLFSALTALFLALGAAIASGLSINWLHLFLFFLVPLLISSITGLLLELDARKNYAQAMLNKQDRLRVVNFIAGLAGDSHSITGTLSQALERLCNHNGWPLGRIATIDKAGLSSTVTFTRSGIESALVNISADLWCPPDSELLAHISSQKEPCWSDCAPLFEEQAAGLMLRKHLIFPIDIDNRVIAILELYSQDKEAPSQRLLSLMNNVGLQLGRIFEHAGQERQLRHKAMHDELTGLPNRAYLFDCLEREISHARRSPNNFCLLFVDVDHFKEVNDSLGHLMGDKLLVKLTERLRQCLRQEDFIARLGGDEFALVIRLAQTDDQTDRLHKVIELIQQRLLKPFKLGQQDLLLGLSIGVALYDERYRTAEELLNDADTAMYSAKRKGRGRFEVFNLGIQQEKNTKHN